MRIILYLLTALFLFSSLYLTDSFNSISSYVIVGISSVIFFSVILFKNIPIMINIKLLLLFYVFTVACGISAFKNQDIRTLFGALAFFLIYLSLAVILPTIFKFKTNEMIAKSVLWSNVPLVIIPLMIYGINSTPYKGIFYNSNSLGSISATLFGVVMAIFLRDFEQYTLDPYTKKIKFRISISLLSMILFFTIVVLSASRTSFISVIGISLFGLILLLFFMAKANKLKTFLIKSTIFAYLMLIIYWLLTIFTTINEFIYNNVIFKFERKRNDILDHRGEIWSQTISDAGLLGQGRDYFINLTIGAHNTFISILGQYGWIPLILFILFFLLAIFYAIKYALTISDDKYKYLPIILLITFLMLSMGEGMMFKVSMLSSFCCLGISSNGNFSFPYQEERNISSRLKKLKRISQT